MNIPQETLDFWPRACERVRAILDEAKTRLHGGDSETATELLELAQAAVLLLGSEIQEAGGARPAEAAAAVEVPLHLLSSRANCRLAETLRRAHAASLAVDKERGAEGSGHAHVLQMLLAEVESQVFGAEGLSADA